MRFLFSVWFLSTVAKNIFTCGSCDSCVNAYLHHYWTACAMLHQCVIYDGVFLRINSKAICLSRNIRCKDVRTSLKIPHYLSVMLTVMDYSIN